MGMTRSSPSMQTFCSSDLRKPALHPGYARWTPGMPRRRTFPPYPAIARFPSSGDEARIQSMSLSWVAGLVCWISVRAVFEKKGALSKLIGRGFRSGLGRYQTLRYDAQKRENRCARVFLRHGSLALPLPPPPPSPSLPPAWLYRIRTLARAGRANRQYHQLCQRSGHSSGEVGGVGTPGDMVVMTDTEFPLFEPRVVKAADRDGRIPVASASRGARIPMYPPKRRCSDSQKRQNGVLQQSAMGRAGTAIQALLARPAMRASRYFSQWRLRRRHPKAMLT